MQSDRSLTVLFTMPPFLVCIIVILALTSTIALQMDHEPFFEFSSGNRSYDTAYLLAMTEMEKNIENGTFIAGAGWKQLWTRDTSYAVELAAGLVHPKLSEHSLKQSIEIDEHTGNDVWLQDLCGHFGGWPNLSDAIVGVRGSWELFLVTGDVDFLSWAYQITQNSLVRAERDAFDDSTGLFKGCSSFMESDSGYPQKYSMNGALVGMTKALSTNMLHYEGYKLSAAMARILGKNNDEIITLEIKAEQLKEAIRSRLWSPEHGYYSYFEDENNELMTQMEGLGESLVLLSTDFEHDSYRIERMFQSVPITKRGIPSLWPRFVYTKDNQCESHWIECYYHNGRVWPFVMGYWGLAAARHGQVEVFANELANLVWLSQRKDTFAEFYEIDGTFPKERSRQLWSNTGFLALVYHGLFGLKFVPNGVEFHPVKPASPFSQTISLRGVHYRNMIMDIHVIGAGTDVESIFVNGRQLDRAFLSGDEKGSHSITITLSGDVISKNEKSWRKDVIVNSLRMLVAFIVALFVFGVRKKASRRRFCPSVIGHAESIRLTQ